MAGHSKWAQIKRSKGAKDVKRGAMFAKMARIIIVAVKTGGGPDPKANFKLRTAIDAAKAEGVPNDNIKRAIEKAQGAGEGADLKEITYEGYLPGGVAVIVKAATDNNNRTLSNVRNAFTKANGSLGNTGCASYMFEEKDGKLEPLSLIPVTQEEDAKNIIKAMELLEDDEDVIDVIANFDIDESLMA